MSVTFRALSDHADATDVLKTVQQYNSEDDEANKEYLRKLLKPVLQANPEIVNAILELAKE